jgi:hypothetical protein
MEEVIFLGGKFLLFCEKKTQQFRVKEQLNYA